MYPTKSFGVVVAMQLFESPLLLGFCHGILGFDDAVGPQPFDLVRILLGMEMINLRTSQKEP